MQALHPSHRGAPADSGTDPTASVCIQMAFTPRGPRRPNRLHTMASSSPHWAGVGLRQLERVSGPRSPGDGMGSDQCCQPLAQAWEASLLLAEHL